MADHTAGPWLTCPDYSRDATCFSVAPWRGLSVAIVGNHRAQLDANVRLIASAPELLAALQAILTVYDATDTRGDPLPLDDEAWDAPIDQARAAVLLATTRKTR